MGEHPKASSAALLRSETRRRKILENSAHRLKLIEGITNRTQSSEKTDTKTSNSLDSPTGFPDRAPSATDIRNVIRNAIQEDNDLKNLSDFLLVKGETEVNENIEEIEAETVSKSKTKNSTLDTLQRKRIHYILLAVTVNIMFYFKFSFMFYNVSSFFNWHRCILFLWIHHLFNYDFISHFRMYFAHFTLWR